MLGSVCGCERLCWQMLGAPGGWALADLGCDCAGTHVRGSD
jgi:hypothetical protein